MSRDVYRRMSVAMPVELRVVPARTGGWRVEDRASVRGQCDTVGEAEQLAERLLRDMGSGQMLIYDAHLRLRAVKRIASVQ